MTEKLNKKENPLIGGLGQTLPFEVVIMAGGKGERMKLLTKDFPKALLKVGEHPISEYLVQRLAKCGIKEFHFCLNHLGEKIRDYFGTGQKWNVNIGYIFEGEPLGTIGGLRLKTDYKFEDILVVNGDLLTTIRFDRFYSFFIEEEADIAVATIPYRVNLPYGILDIDSENEVHSIKEKPIFTYHLNTGIYFIRKEILSLIPSDSSFDAVDLIQEAIKAGKKVSSYPMHEYWIDIGQMEDYQKAQEDIHFLDI